MNRAVLALAAFVAGPLHAATFDLKAAMRALETATARMPPLQPLSR